jgi:hypothetical protein
VEAISKIRNKTMTLDEAMGMVNRGELRPLENLAVKQALARRRMQLRERIEDEDSGYALDVLNDLLGEE